MSMYHHDDSATRDMTRQAMGSHSMSDTMRCHVDMHIHDSVINSKQVQH